MAKNETTPKIGAGHASAMFRQGLAELRAAAYFQESNIAQPTVYGMAGNKTPGEVMQEKLGDVHDPDEKPSILDERLKQVEKDQQGREPERPERERD